MTHGDSLSLTIDATHRSLEQRLEGMLVPARGRRHTRDVYAAVDAFLAATSRHLAAVDAVLLPLVRKRVPDGAAFVHEYLDQARDLEMRLASLKARLYGEAHAVHLSWAGLCSDVRQELLQHNAMEQTLVGRLVTHLDASMLNGLAQQVFRYEVTAPTRPHPHIPHTGMPGRVARRVWAQADRFWDTAEGRVIPDPVRPVPHRHDSLVAQYLLGDPHFDIGASVLQHRRG
jgi:hypothetical protein